MTILEALIPWPTLADDRDPSAQRRELRHYCPPCWMRVETQTHRRRGASTLTRTILYGVLLTLNLVFLLGLGPNFSASTVLDVLYFNLFLWVLLVGWQLCVRRQRIKAAVRSRWAMPPNPFADPDSAPKADEAGRR